MQAYSNSLFEALKSAYEELEITDPDSLERCYDD